MPTAAPAQWPMTGDHANGLCRVRVALSSCVQEQAQLLSAYDAANKDAAQRIKHLEAQVKAKGDELTSQRQAHEREMTRALESQQHTNADTAQKLRCNHASLRRHMYAMNAVLAATE